MNAEDKVYKYQVLDDVDFWMLKTDSFYKAVRYAYKNKWRVYDVERQVLIYDGARDLFYGEEVRA